MKTEKTNKGVDFPNRIWPYFFSRWKVTSAILVERASICLGYTRREEILKSGVAARTLFLNGRDGEVVREIIERQGHVKDCELADTGCGSLDYTR